MATRIKASATAVYTAIPAKTVNQLRASRAEPVHHGVTRTSAVTEAASNR